MRIQIICLFLLMGGWVMAQTASKVHLFPCPEAGLWGFRNVDGKSAIPAQFPSARRFHEGLAAVRKDARYGYIDSTGAWAIPPQFDGALDFEKGVAKVFLNGRANFIDRKGKLLFDRWYPNVQHGAHPDLFVYWMEDQTCGLMDRKGKHLGKGGYLHIHVDKSGSSVAVLGHESKVGDDAGKLANGAAILDARGRFILKPQEEEISPFYGCLAKMVKKVGDLYVGSYYDTKGKMRFSDSDLPGWFPNGSPEFADGLATIVMSLKDEERPKNRRPEYAGVIDMDGKLVFSNKDWLNVSQFESGLAFALDANYDYWPIDRTGKQLSNAGFDYVFKNSSTFRFDLLQNGLAFAVQGKDIVALDSTGAVKWRKPLMVNGYEWFCRNGDVVYFQENEGYDLPEYYGYWNVRTGIFSEPKYHQLDHALGEERAMIGLRSEHFVLIDDAGTEVWQENERLSKVPRPKNIDHQLPAIFDFENVPEVNVFEFEEDFGLGAADIGLGPITQPERFPAGAASIYVSDSAKPDIQTRLVDWKVALVNTRADSLELAIFQSYPLAWLQAQDSSGAWRNISNLYYEPTEGDCKVHKMPPGYALWAVVPAMEGAFPTKLRIAWALTVADMKEGKFILSKEFPGSVNPGQFFSEDVTYPSGFPRLY